MNSEYIAIQITVLCSIFWELTHKEKTVQSNTNVKVAFIAQIFLLKHSLFLTSHQLFPNIFCSEMQPGERGMGAHGFPTSAQRSSSSALPCCFQDWVGDSSPEPNPPWAVPSAPTCGAVIWEGPSEGEREGGGRG